MWSSCARRVEWAEQNTRNLCDPRTVAPQRVDPSRAINLDLGEPWLVLLHIFNQWCLLSCLLHFSWLDSGILKLLEYLKEQGWNPKWNITPIWLSHFNLSIICLDFLSICVSRQGRERNRKNTLQINHNHIYVYGHLFKLTATISFSPFHQVPFFLSPNILPTCSNTQTLKETR